MINPNDERIKNNIPKIKKFLKDPNIEIYLQASVSLRNLIIAGQHPFVKPKSPENPNGLPVQFASILAEGKGFRITKSMIIKWLTGVLDERNSFLLQHGEIRVIGAGEQLMKLLEANT